MSVVDIEKVNFYSGDAIDKIVYVSPDPIVVFNDGAGTPSPQASKIVEVSIPNPYGKRVYARYKWSIDGGAYNNEDAKSVFQYSYFLSYVPITNQLGGIRGRVSVGVGDTDILIRTANGDHGTVTDNNVTITWTPIAHTYRILLALFEKE